MANAQVDSLPYDEPNIETILVLGWFLILLNVINAVIDDVLYCGLIGQLLVGVTWGPPGAKLLGSDVEYAVVQLGYLGLILIIYEGGLSTSFTSLKANLLLSVAVALTGIATPIGLSFFLRPLIKATPLQAFAAGAALCSTSLGTTFTVLSATGLSTTRLGVVLSSAAMLDDVVGLVMVQVISNLGASGTSIDAVTVVRPILVSAAAVLLLPLGCWMVVRPLTTYLNRKRVANPGGRLDRFFHNCCTVFIIHTLILFASVTAASYAGTSNLFLAYLAGAAVSWWDTNAPHIDATAQFRESCRPSSVANSEQPVPTPAVEPSEDDQPRASTSSQRPSSEVGEPAQNSQDLSGLGTYDQYCRGAVDRLLKPFFFASIGFSIPITRMFSGGVVWRGLIYATLMAVSKMACGIWLVRFPLQSAFAKFVGFFRLTSSRQKATTKCGQPQEQGEQGAGSGIELVDRASARVVRHPGSSSALRQSAAANDSDKARQPTSAPAEAPSRRRSTPTQAPVAHISPSPSKPLSLYPAAIISLAMIARGEIGFLLSAIAQSHGLFDSAGSSSDSESELFLIVTWAIALCTMIGPLSVGILVRRVRRLEKNPRNGTTTRVFGVWGVAS